MSTYETRFEAMLAAREAGEPDSAIAARFGITRQRVHRILGARPAKQVVEAAAPLPPLGPLVKAWRHQRGFTQVQAGEHLGLNVFTISKIETGRPSKFDVEIRNIVNSFE